MQGKRIDLHGSRRVRVCRRGLRRLVGRLLVLQFFPGKLDREPASLAGFASHQDHAPQQLGHLVDQREPQAGACILAGQAAVDLGERLEDTAQVSLLDADPRVPDRRAMIRRVESPTTFSPIEPPMGVNLTALLSKLTRTCLSRFSSVSMTLTERISMDTCNFNLCADSLMSRIDDLQTAATSTGRVR